MKIEEARKFEGKLVMTTCAGHKMVVSSLSHGPYKLLKVTKSGHCILEGREEFRPTISQFQPIITMNAIELGALIEQYKKDKKADELITCAISGFKSWDSLRRMEHEICNEIFGEGWLDKQRESPEEEKEDGDWF